MKIIDAFWEIRNLGVSTLEIIIEEEDTPERIKDKISEFSNQYIVVKIPAGRVDIMFLMSELHFTFIESSIHITNDLKNAQLNSIQQRLSDSITCEIMNEEDIQELFAEIKKGMFTTDRIYLDPYFTKVQAANRYVGWISDEIGRGTDVYKMIYKEDTIGFFTLKDLGEGVYYPFLVGIYEKYRKSGLGFFIYQKLIDMTKTKNGKLISTNVSMSNLNALRAHLSFNFEIQDIAYIFIKHFDSGR